MHVALQLAHGAGEAADEALGLESGGGESRFRGGCQFDQGPGQGLEAGGPLLAVVALGLDGPARLVEVVAHAVELGLDLPGQGGLGDEGLVLALQAGDVALGIAEGVGAVGELLGEAVDLLR